MSPIALSIGRVALTLAFVGGAVVALVLLWRRYEDDPWTRDGRLRADSVAVAADVSGLVTRILVRDNEFVRAGTVLFVVDRQRFEAQLEQADAAIARARATYDNAVREQRRYTALGDLVSREERDRHVTTADVARASLRQAQADRKVARIDLDRSEVRARVDGFVTGLAMRPGDYVTSGKPNFALLDTASYHVLGYFEETKLHRIHPGDRARIVLLGDTRPLWGHVASIAAGITDREDMAQDGSLPNVNPTFSWIRLVQRVPVRIAIDRIPRGIALVAGRTASIAILAPAPAPASAPRSGPSADPSPASAIALSASGTR